MRLDPKKVRRVMLRSGELIRNEAMDEAPVETSDLKRSIIVAPYGDVGARVGPTVDYGLYVHEGTGKHGPKKKSYEIKPKKKKALKFKHNGEDGFAKSVMHPGIEANKFMDRAYEAAEDEIHDLVAEDLGDDIADQVTRRLKDGM